MSERHETTVAEVFAKGLDAICLCDRLKFSSKRKEVKEIVKEGLSREKSLNFDE